MFSSALTTVDIFYDCCIITFSCYCYRIEKMFGIFNIVRNRRSLTLNVFNVTNFYSIGGVTFN